jgi:hypothetical protein
MHLEETENELLMKQNNKTNYTNTQYTINKLYFNIIRCLSLFIATSLQVGNKFFQANTLEDALRALFRLQAVSMIEGVQFVKHSDLTIDINEIENTELKCL